MAESEDLRRGETVAVEFPLYIVRRLRPAAAQRNTTVPRLINDLIEAVAADGLTAAVLDDVPRTPRYRPRA
jgi:hypothetical protein